MAFTAFLLGAQHKKEIVWRTSRQACLLCPWARHLMGRLHLYFVDRWPTRTSPVYNCKVTNPSCREGRLLGTHQWQSALLVVGLPVTHEWLEIGCHLSPRLILIRLIAWTWIAVCAVPPSRGRGGVITTTATITTTSPCSFIRSIAKIWYMPSDQMLCIRVSYILCKLPIYQHWNPAFRSWCWTNSLFTCIFGWLKNYYYDKYTNSPSFYSGGITVALWQN